MVRTAINSTPYPQLGHERDRERLGGAQGGDDELLRMPADGQSLERRGCDLGDGADIGARFTSDEYLVPHAAEFLSGSANGASAMASR